MTITGIPATIIGICLLGAMFYPLYGPFVSLYFHHIRLICKYKPSEVEKIKKAYKKPKKEPSTEEVLEEIRKLKIYPGDRIIEIYDPPALNTNDYQVLKVEEYQVLIQRIFRKHGKEILGYERYITKESLLYGEQAFDVRDMRYVIRDREL